MKRSVSVLLLVSLFSFLGTTGAEAKTYKNCTELRKTYKYGISQSSKAVNKGAGPIYTPRVSAAIYKANIKLDLDKDKIICEVVGPKPKPTPTPTPTDSALPTDTSASLLSNIELCRISQGSSPTAPLRTGFPRNTELTIKNSKAVVQLIYVDFSDLTDSAPPSADVDFWKVGVNQFFDAMSDGKVTFEWRYENKYLRMPKSLASYKITRTGGGDFTQFVQDAITLADPTVNFTDVDYVVAVMPPNVTRALADVSPALVRTASSPFITAEGSVYRGTLAAADTRFNEGYLLIAHEFGHLMGLQDYYYYGWTQSMPFPDQFKYMGQFDNMNFATGDSREWTAWSRWILSFLEDSKVRCVGSTSPAETTHALSAASAKTTNNQMVVVPTSNTSAIVIESRRNLRYDAKAKEVSNGLLVYRVNTQNNSGYGPIEVIRKTTTKDLYLADAPLKKGDSITVDGITITNVDSDSKWDLAKVTISR